MIDEKAISELAAKHEVYALLPNLVAFAEALSIMRAVQVGEDRLFSPWKCGNEFLPFHPQASHVRPDYRDGWNDCFKAASAFAPPEPSEVKP